MDANTNSVNWVEIPAVDINRAKKFYETIFGISMSDPQEMMGTKMSMFPYNPGAGKVAGGICQGEFYKPSSDGALVYLNANPDMQPVIDKIEKAGGKVLMPKTQITPEIGHMAFFMDSEGNRMALHSQN